MRLAVRLAAGLALGLVALGLVALAGCGRRTSSSQAPQLEFKQVPANLGRIGMSAPGHTAFDAAVAEGIEESARAAGYQLETVAPADNAQTQAQQLAYLARQGVLAIVIVPADPRGLAAAIRQVSAAGIPVFTAIHPTDGAAQADVVAHVGTDNDRGGALAAEAIFASLPEEGGQVLLLTDDADPASEARSRGFRGRLAALEQQPARPQPPPGLPREPLTLEVCAPSQRHAPHEARQIELVEAAVTAPPTDAVAQALAAHPDAAAVFCVNDSLALAAADALDRPAADVMIVGFGATRAAREAIADERLAASVIEFPEEIGARAMRAVLRHLAREPLPRQDLVAPELYRLEDAAEDPLLPPRPAPPTAPQSPSDR